MDETIITPRQRLVLNLVNASNGLYRRDIQREIEKTYKISKPTLARDLKLLINDKLIRVEGKGRNTKYFSFSKNPLLKVFNLDQYFSVEPDLREVVKGRYDFEIINYFNNIFTHSELQTINEIKISFNNRISTVDPTIIKKEIERFVIELSWKSSKIEGNTYSLLETEALIKELKEAQGKSKEETTMILNHKDAFEAVLNNRNGFTSLNMTKINQLHNVLIKGMNISTGIRKQAVGITGTVYQPLDNEHQIIEAMQDFVKKVNENKNPLEKAFMVSAMIPYIQPYSDGNKRTGRMLTNAILLAYDYYPLSYRSVNEDEYKKALILFYEQGSVFRLKQIFVEQLVFAYKTYFR